MSREVKFEIHTEVDRNSVMRQVNEMVGKGIKAGPVVITLGRPKRNLNQNAMMWSLLTDISSQVNWHGQYLQPEDWKNICTASLKKQQAVPGIDGGVVMIGASTSRMNKAQFSELIELILAFGAEHNVKFKQDVIDEYYKTKDE